MKYIAPSQKVVKQLPSEQLLKNYGKSLKLLLAEKDIPDLHFDITDRKEKGDSSEKTEVMEIMDVNTRRSAMTPQNSDFREHSRNLLENAVGEAQERVSEQRSVKQALDPELHSNASEYREHSQKSRSSGKSTNVETPGNIVHQTLERRVHPGDSESREHSKNSRVKEVEVTVSAEITERPAASSDFPKTRCQVMNVKWTMEKQRCLLGIVMVSVRWRSANSENFLQTRGW